MDHAPVMAVVMDAVEGPIVVRHEDAAIPAARRFRLPDGKDMTIAVGYRAVFEYNVFEARYILLQYLPWNAS